MLSQVYSSCVHGNHTARPDFAGHLRLLRQKTRLHLDKSVIGTVEPCRIPPLLNCHYRSDSDPADITIPLHGTGRDLWNGPTQQRSFGTNTEQAKFKEPFTTIPMAPIGNGPTIGLSPALETFPSANSSASTTARQESSRGLNDATGQLPSSSAIISPRPDLKREAERLKTFENWPVSFLERKLMANAGFYYTRRADLVKCAFCGVEIGKWEQGDDPLRDHLRWKPHCPFLKNMNVGNVPIAQESTTPHSSESLERKSYDTCGPYGIEVRPFSGPENELSQPSLELLGVNKASAPVHKSFITCEARVKSFDHWPVSMKQKPDVLSDAGFFYTGKGDQTICFHCGGGLKDWVETDDPWEEHATWFPKCNFVLLRKGKSFVDQFSAHFNANLTSKEALEIAPTQDVSAPVLEAIPMETGRCDNDARLCKICCVEELGVVFLPCGHMVACVKCAPSISACPVCRQPLTATVRAYLP